MNVVIMFFHIVVITVVIVNILKIVKLFSSNHRIFDNLEDMVRQRYNNMMQNNVTQENKVVNNIETSVDLDVFMKSNSNPIKEVKGKRSKI